jgi:hypothetical protein
LARRARRDSRVRRAVIGVSLGLLVAAGVVVARGPSATNVDEHPVAPPPATPKPAPEIAAPQIESPVAAPAPTPAPVPTPAPDPPKRAKHVERKRVAPRAATPKGPTFDPESARPPR